jgi:hypothetical protein
VQWEVMGNFISAFSDGRVGKDATDNSEWRCYAQSEMSVLKEILICARVYIRKVICIIFISNLNIWNLLTFSLQFLNVLFPPSVCQCEEESRLTFRVIYYSKLYGIITHFVI